MKKMHILVGLALGLTLGLIAQPLWAMNPNWAQPQFTDDPHRLTPPEMIRVRRLQELAPALEAFRQGNLYPLPEPSVIQKTNRGRLQLAWQRAEGRAFQLLQEWTQVLKMSSDFYDGEQVLDGLMGQMMTENLINPKLSAQTQVLGSIRQELVGTLEQRNIWLFDQGLASLHDNETVAVDAFVAFVSTLGEEFIQWDPLEQFYFLSAISNYSKAGVKEFPWVTQLISRLDANRVLSYQRFMVLLDATAKGALEAFLFEAQFAQAEFKKDQVGSYRERAGIFRLSVRVGQEHLAELNQKREALIRQGRSLAQLREVQGLGALKKEYAEISWQRAEEARNLFRHFAIASLSSVLEQEALALDCRILLDPSARPKVAPIGEAMTF